MTTPGEWKKKLFFGYNLGILRESVGAESVDLVYQDPPFKGNATYNVLFGLKSRERLAAQNITFENIWHWGIEAEEAFPELLKSIACVEVLNWKDANKLSHRAIGNVYYTDTNKSDSYLKRVPKRKKIKGDDTPPAGGTATK